MNNDLDPAKAQLVVNHRSSSAALMGIVLIVLGALFFMDRLGWDLGWRWHPTFARMWPILLIVAGLVQLTSAGRDTVVTATAGQERRSRRGRSFPGLWWLFIGMIMLLDQNRWFTLDRSWPLFIVAGGLIILLRPRGQICRGT
jgi:hypothetical protein